MIVVTTPTGFIGEKLVRLLLAREESVRVVARNPDKLAPELRSKLEVVQGSSDDEAVLGAACAGAHGLFHVVPPDFSAPDVVDYYLRFTRPAIAALKRHGVKRVVTISGIGRDDALPAGPVSAALAKDRAFERAGLDVRALWCPSFMENTLRNVQSLRSAGVFVGPSRRDLKQPFVATQDIAAVAARLLLDRSWSGPGGEAVLGPEDLSFDDRAAIMSEVLGRPIRYEQLPAAAHKAQLIKFGASEAFAQGLLDMHAAKDHGLDLSEPRTPENTTPTHFRDWCVEVLEPALSSEPL